MNREKQKILLFFLIAFSVYCALLVGVTWDEEFHIIQGKITLDYLLSFGEINQDILYRENYSAIYWTLSHLITKQFPTHYQFELSHLINLFFSLGAVFGAGKFGSEIFNKKIGKIIFLILFFYPIFFGHMAINSKDTILAFSHIWISYLLLRYIKKQNIKEKSNKYIFYLAILAAVATGIQLVFLGSLIPIVLFILIEIYFLKKITTKHFNSRRLLFDIFKCFLIFYTLLIIFWIDAHSNILISPFSIIMATFSESYWTGWPFNLVNGNYYISNQVPKSYLFLNIFFKSPEYILLCYLFFAIAFIKSRKFFQDRFILFNYKILLIIIILVFPNIILFFIPYPLYDGVRLFLWTLPYICIIPGLLIYYLIENFRYKIHKISSAFLSFFILYFLFYFFAITPYQYTYLNIFNGQKETRFKKFENDYWGASLKELINNTDFKTDKTLNFAVCGVNPIIAEFYLKKKVQNNINFVNASDADFFIMTNRVVMENDQTDASPKLINCFDKFKGNDISKVERNGLILSLIRKKI
tara:strand:+ start:542 stop:2122 length:1581 start_codon:yes stop_codon:yes gene_type:complete